VWAVEVHRKRGTLRRSRRPVDALEWELDLIEFVSRHGVGAPNLVPNVAGERSWQHFFVTSWVDGWRPQTDADWTRVADALRRMHELTRDWTQRPTFASTSDLLTREVGGDVDLSRMPLEAVSLCRAAWAAIAGSPVSAIHGDPRGNVFMTSDGVMFIDWDETRLDASVLDLADLPGDHIPMSESRAVRRAASAWEAAVSWDWERDYAQRRLAELTSNQTQWPFKS
jgi:Ser/Thr protein kinase RdoA (MazF antagonist)